MRECKRERDMSKTKDIKIKMGEGANLRKGRILTNNERTKRVYVCMGVGVSECTCAGVSECTCAFVRSYVCVRVYTYMHACYNACVREVSRHKCDDEAELKE